MSPPKNVTREFRAALIKIMPGYDWTVHRSMSEKVLQATGTQSSGFNRLSTLHITRTEKDGYFTYQAKSAGFGLRAPWLRSYTDGTLARALRGLEEIYRSEAKTFHSHAAHLASGRKPTPAEEGAAQP